jgi:hypothetical protein
MIDLIDLIGLEFTDNEVNSFVQYLHPNKNKPLEEPVLKQYSDVIYVSYLSLGLSFQVNPTSSKIDAIECYSAKSNSKQFQSEYEGPLPFGFRIDMDNKQIVTKFGEPDKKGGGSIPIWISYEVEKSDRTIPKKNSNGILVKSQVDFLHRQWDIVPNPVSHYTFFI